MFSETILVENKNSSNNSDYFVNNNSNQNKSQNRNNKSKKRVTFTDKIEIIPIENWKSFNIDVSLSGGCKEWDREFIQRILEKGEKKHKNIEKRKNKRKNLLNKNTKNIFFNFCILLDENLGNNFGFCYENKIDKKLKENEDMKNMISNNNKSDFENICIIF